MLKNLLLLDIETVPARSSFNNMDPDWQRLFCDKISKTVPEGTNPEESYRKKAGILAEFGRIICISTAFFHTDDEGHLHLKMKSIAGDDEVEILRIFTQLCEKIQQINPYFQFAGHNIREFDIPYIGRRMLINNLSLPACFQIQDRKPWELKMFDTLNWWKFGDHKNYVSLDLLAHVLGISSSKTDMDGSMVQDVYYVDNDLPRIVAYCERDVVVTANIILRFLQQPILKPENIAVVTV
ncbi:MAG: ribonuclease H-like domain-containing protein [Bacteroidota bacterium]